jgi:hypothetical protein
LAGSTASLLRTPSHRSRSDRETPQASGATCARVRYGWPLCDGLASIAATKRSLSAALLSQRHHVTVTQRGDRWSGPPARRGFHHGQRNPLAGGRAYHQIVESDVTACPIRRWHSSAGNCRRPNNIAAYDRQRLFKEGAELDSNLLDVDQVARK